MAIYTGCYKDVKSGNLISISGDKGVRVSFNGKYIKVLAPKYSFWKVWHDNFGKIPEEENTYYYIENYYNLVLKNIDVLELLKDEENPVLLCYEGNDSFCHRHILAFFIEMKYDIIVREIKCLEDGNVVYLERPSYIKDMLLDVMSKDVSLRLKNN